MNLTAELVVRSAFMNRSFSLELAELLVAVRLEDRRPGFPVGHDVTIDAQGSFLNAGPGDAYKERRPAILCMTDSTQGGRPWSK